MGVIIPILQIEVSREKRLRPQGYGAVKLGASSSGYAQRFFHWAPTPVRKTWSSACSRDWPRLSLKATRQPSSLAQLHFPCLPFMNNVLPWRR